MSKHPLDHDHSNSSARLAQFAKLERTHIPSQAARILQQRNRNETDSRLTKFIKIERGAEV